MTTTQAARLLLAAVLTLLGTACGGEPEASALPQDAAAAREALARISDGPHDVAVLDLGELGQIRIELLPEIAPRTVAHFVELAEQGVYDGTTFHRVIPGFMIQGGNPASRDADPRNDGSSSAPTIPDEFSGYPHVRGTVSLANKGHPGSGGGQFFIVHQDARHLDGRYAAFGRVIAGMEGVDAVTELEIDVYGRYGLRNRPYPVDARIHEVRIERAEERSPGERQERRAASERPDAPLAATGSKG